jgi:hypothetical protein
LFLVAFKRGVSISALDSVIEVGWMMNEGRSSAKDEQGQIDIA